MNINKYFGTDGIRGKFGENPITFDFFFKLGISIGKVLAKDNSKTVIIGKDTRKSGSILDLALRNGLNYSGVKIISAGIIPTPAIAYLTKKLNIEAGIIISASHNYYKDNGIKIFDKNGYKISTNIEKLIELEIKNIKNYKKINYIKKNNIFNKAKKIYINFCKNTINNDLNLKNFKIIIDCANGSTYKIAPYLFKSLGAKIIMIGCIPNGKNINKECGSTNIKKLKHYVLKEKANLGIAFDGDGDRLIMVDNLGKKVEGDKIIYILAKEFLKNNNFKKGVVGTHISNMSLELELNKINIPFYRSKIGDKYIVNLLNKKKLLIGGENSGHIILLNKTTTGDALIIALQILKIIKNNNVNLHDLSNQINLFPQILLNIPINHINTFKKNAIIKNKIFELKEKFNNKIRIILRKSGTEPLMRILIEGKNKDLIHKVLKEIKNTIKK